MTTINRGLVVYLEENNVNKNTIKEISTIIIDITRTIFMPSSG
jgi:hypothetical protein